MSQSQHQFIGIEEDGYNYFGHQIRQMQLVLSKSTMNRQKKQEKGVVTLKEQPLAKWNHSRPQQKKLKWIEKVSSDTVNCPREQLSAPTQSTPQFLQNFKHNPALIISLSQPLESLSQTPETKSQQISQQYSLPNLPQQDLESVSIDLNPKRLIKKGKKDKKEKVQKIILDKCENPLELKGAYEQQSIFIKNDISLSKSDIQSEKSINLAILIKKQLDKCQPADFLSFPMRQIIAKIYTNGCVGGVKVECVDILPLKEILKVGSSKNSSNIFTFKQTKYELPRQYKNQQKMIYLGTMRVPQLTISMEKDQEYYEILGGMLIKIANARLKCANCSARSLVTFKHHSAAMESCQHCSMTLEIMIKSIAIKPQH